MYSLNSGDVSYIVPMDHVDLNFLRRCEQIGDKVKPLWSPRQDEYTEFQLKAWRRDSSEEQHDKNAKITTMCHICDTQVPIAYLKEHSNSKKHKNFLKIIDEALSRLRSNINLNATHPPTEPPKSTYFCETCCLSVPSSNREIHEGSAVHKTSTLHDEILENVLMVFEKNSNSDYAVDNNMNGNNNSVHEDQDSTEATPLEQLKDYINEITLKMTDDSVKIDVLDENYIVITVNGNRFRVHIDNFNGFVKVNHEVECILCDVVVKSKSGHIWTGPHMRRVIWSLVDEQCIRQIDRYDAHCIICNELIQNVRGHKALDSNHTNKLKNALYTLNSATSHQTQTLMRNSETTAAAQIENKKNDENHPVPIRENIEMKTENTDAKFVHYLFLQRDLNSKDVLCRLCFCGVPDKQTNIDEHLNGKSHKINYNVLLSHNHMNKVPNGFSCDFCLVHVPGTTELDHVLSEDHQTKMKNGIATNKTYCDSCMVYIDTHNFEHHRNGRRHKQNASPQTTANDIAKSNSVDTSKTNATVPSNPVQGTTLNKPHDTKVVQNASQTISTQNIPPSSVINIKSSVSEKSTNVQLLQSIQTSTSNINVKTPIANMKSSNIKPKTKFDQPVENNNQPSTSGLKKDQASELKNMQSLMSSTSEKKTSDIRNIQPSQSQTNNSEPVLKIKLHYHFKETSDPKQLLCKVCNKPVPNTKDNITSHINGNNHKTNYKNMLKFNKVVEVDTNFYCHKCNVHITSKNEIDHILGNRHKNTLSDDTVSTPNDTSDPYLLSERISRIVKTTEYITKLHLFDQTIKPEEVLCKVCLTIVCNTEDNVISHANGVSHLTKYNNFLELNRIAKLEDGFYCDICKENVANYKEFHHVASDEHFNNTYNDDTSDDEPYNEIYCGFCKVFVHETDYLKHKISGTHVYRVKNVSKGTFKVYYYKATLKSYLKCELCKCNVNNEYECALEHIEESRHSTAYLNS